MVRLTAPSRRVRFRRLAFRDNADKVTHAAGRMGVSVVGQLHERWQMASPEEPLEIRAIVRSGEEASRLKLDLCGAVIRGGVMSPLLDIEADLGIKVYVVPDDLAEPSGLARAFDGADTAVLLSAAHADFAPAATDDLQLERSQLNVDEPSVGSVFHRRASSAYAAALKAAKNSSVGLNVRVPPLASAAASRRLGAEIAAVATAPSMRHVVLRSSMGVAALNKVSGSAAGNDAEDEKRLALAAIKRMGGAMSIAGQADAEGALRARCKQSGASSTILRLGALVDSAGGVPLSFGKGDEQLLEGLEDGATEPPLISRNDAARLVVEVVCEGLPSLADATIDAAWGDKWGMSSAGCEEAARAASRQPLLEGAVLALQKSETASAISSEKLA